MSVCMHSNGIVARRWGSREICCLDFASPQDAHSSLVLSIIVICLAFARAWMQSREICPSQLCHSIRGAFRSVLGSRFGFEVSGEAVTVVSAIGTIIWS